MSMMFHRSMATALPTLMNVKRPTILQDMVSERFAPVASIHAHHFNENSLEERIVSVQFSKAGHVEG